MKRQLILMAAGVALAFGGISAAMATSQGGTGQNRGEDDLNVGQARITLTQAVAAAEQKVGGRAAHAELNDENGKLVFGVEVVSGQQATDVKVDAMSGQVLSARADQADAEHEGKGESDND